MKEITNEELKQLTGGGISVWGGIGIGALITFLVGVVDGFVRPLKCN
jgi:hypothetical protein